MNKLYKRGMIAQYWYNFTEALVYGLTYKSTPDDIQYHEKVRYGNDKLQYINIYQHNDNKKRPLLIYIHGGSWVSGITEMRNSYISEWAKIGFNTAAISYSYSPQKLFPSQLQEVFNAIDFLYDNADKYNFDINNILLAGESAGGYFVSYVASVLKDETALKALNLEFKHRDKINIKSLLTLSGCYDLKRLADKSKPQASFPDLKTMITSYLGLEYNDAVEYLNSEEGKFISPIVNNSYPPAFLIWGDKDLLRYESFDFSEQLRSNNVNCKLYKADGLIGMHAWSIVMLFKKSKECLKKSFDFILPYFSDYFERDSYLNWNFK